MNPLHAYARTNSHTKNTSTYGDLVAGDFYGPLLRFECALHPVDEPHHRLLLFGVVEANHNAARTVREAGFRREVLCGEKITNKKKYGKLMRDSYIRSIHKHTCTTTLPCTTACTHSVNTGKRMHTRRQRTHLIIHIANDKRNIHIRTASMFKTTHICVSTFSKSTCAPIFNLRMVGAAALFFSASLNWSGPANTK